MQLIVNALIAGSLAALIAGGLALVYGTIGVFNLALGQTVLIGGYTTWWLMDALHMPLLPAICGGLMNGAVVSLITYKFCIEPFFKYHRFLPLITTIALSMVLDGVVLLLFKESPRSILPGLKEPLNIAGALVSKEQIVLIVATLIVLAICAYVLHSTRLGRRIRAVVQHASAAESLGIQSSRLYQALLIWSGVLAAGGGIFIGIDQNLSPTLAFPLTIKAYAAVIAGGRGSFWGAIIASYCIALFEQLAVGVHWFGTFYIPAGYQQSVALLIIIVFLLLRPHGMFGSPLRAT